MRAVSRLAAGAVAVGAIDLALRLVARRGLLRLLGGASDPAAATVLLATLACVLAGIIAARRLGRSPVAFIVAGAIAAGLVTQGALGARLQSDGFYYYAYLRSLAFDRDVNLANDYRLLGLDDAQHRFLFQPTVTGHAQSAWAVGPAIAWSPFLAAGHLVARHLAARGEEVAVDGTSYPYRQSVVVAGLVYGVLGLWFAFNFVRIFAAARDAAAGVMLTAAGSFMLWYLVREPTMSHALSMASVAGFLWCWAGGGEKRSPAGWFLLGLAGGLMAAIRWQNVLMFMLPAVALLRDFRHSPRQLLRIAVVMTGGTLVGFAPQMLAWNSIYGHVIAQSPVGPPLFWWHPQIVDVLWSSRNGLFAWSPIFIPAIAGLVAFARREPLVGWTALAIFVLMTWVNGAVDDWWGGAGYGMRRFDSVVPLAALGLAAALPVLASAFERRPHLVIGTTVAMLLVWNVSLMGVAASGAFRIGEPISFGQVGGRQAFLVHRWFGHVFSYPVSLIYAVRNGVAPWRFDLLRPYRFLGDPRRPYGRIDIGARGDAVYLADGWHDAEQDGATPFRWASQSATVLVPLDHAAPLKVQLRLHAFGYPGAPLQRATVRVNGHASGPVDVGTGWGTIEVLTEASSWRSGVNRVEIEFEWAERPTDVGAGGDTRELAAAVSYVRVSVN